MSRDFYNDYYKGTLRVQVQSDTTATVYRPTTLRQISIQGTHEVIALAWALGWRPLCERCVENHRLLCCPDGHTQSDFYKPALEYLKQDRFWDDPGGIVPKDEKKCPWWKFWGHP